MAALPYMPLYVADYLADASHLTTMQHGAYLLLIMNYWQRGEPLPNDDAKLARIARLGLREWKRIRPEIEGFFNVLSSAWTHSRIDAELSRVAAKSLKCKKAGQASVQRRFNGRSTDAEQTLNHTDTDTSSSVDKSTGGEPPAKDDDPVKELFDIGVSILTQAGQSEKQARSLIGKWRKAKSDGDVLTGLIECRSKAISEPVEWLTKRFNGAKWVSKSGYEYRGDFDAVLKEAENRADWDTYWSVVAAKSEAATK